MDLRFEADMLRALGTIVENGHIARCQAGALVFRLRLGIGRSRDRVRRQGVTGRGCGLRRGRRQASWPPVRPWHRDAIVAVPIWTTTPWTLPASLAVSLGPELDYVSGRRAPWRWKRVLLVIAEALPAVRCCATAWK
jgi:isoleucyl-tRNA synthetase